MATKAAWFNGDRLEKETIRKKKEKMKERTLTLTGLLMEGLEGHGLCRAPGRLSVVVVSRRTVITASPHAALLESGVQNRRGRGRSYLAFQIGPSRHGRSDYHA